MSQFNPESLKKLYIPAADSHKGQNGKLLLIGGSKLFHAASLWPLTVASRMLDMVFYSSVPENNELVSRAKEEFRNGIVVPRSNIDHYIEEADVILIGPGLPRAEGREEGDEDTKELTESLLRKYPGKKWVIDGGSLQTVSISVLTDLTAVPILTPHRNEFETIKAQSEGLSLSDEVIFTSKVYNAVVLLKGEVDLIASPKGEFVEIPGGNVGMTKGGTGDVLAGLVASLYCKNDAFLAAAAASYINKKAGESLEKTLGLNFNASDLSLEIPKVLKELIG